MTVLLKTRLAKVFIAPDYISYLVATVFARVDCKLIAVLLMIKADKITEPDI